MSARGASLPRPLLGLAGLAAALLALLVLASAASATSYQRPFEEAFGSAGQPTFIWPQSLATDAKTGDVLVTDFDNGATDKSANLTIYRYHPDGTPAPFTDLGSNVIDGKAGAGGKPCAEEPASCDETPEGGLEDGLTTPQIAVAPDTGDIYLSQYYGNLVDIFSAKGKYLGQLTAAGLKAIEHVCGVAVSPSGDVYVQAGVTLGGRNYASIAKFVPSGNPPVNTDSTAVFPLPGYQAVCQMAAGSGSSAGWLFTFAQIPNSGPSGNQTLKVNDETGEFSVFAENTNRPLTVAPTTGNPIVHAGSYGAEFDGSLESTSTPLSLLTGEGHGGVGALAANSSGEIYTAGGFEGSISVYGHPAIVPTVSVNPATAITATQATLTGTVEPEGIEVSACVFEWWPIGGFRSRQAKPCEPEEALSDAGEHPVHVTISGLKANGTEYEFRLAATNENGTEHSEWGSFKTAGTVTTEPATAIGRDGATLNGVVNPEGSQYTECVFEWGPVTAAYEHTEDCHPEAAKISAEAGEYPVALPLTGLAEATTYHFRLKATNGEGTVTGAELTFETLGPPLITDTRARDASKDAATIEAEIDPSGFETSYRFEWGPTASYGHQILEEQPIGEGTIPVRVGADVSGLSPASTYHYRVVATSDGGVTTGTDHTFETLNSCGLAEGRCYELVSRRDAGPIGIPGEIIAAAEMHFQAGRQGSGALAYVVEAGYPEATKGAEVLYRGTRNAAARTWESTQLSAPILAPNERKGSGSSYGVTRWLADDLSCGFTETWQPLTDDPATRFVIENGGSNLYRVNPDNSYTAVSYLAPENPEDTILNNFTMIGASQDCAKAFFSSVYDYPGIAGEGSPRLYEWDEGTLRSAGVIPGPEGETPASATGKAVSDDGSRVFFTAARKTSPDPAEIGKRAIFVREDGTTSRDLTLSETSTPAGDATFQWATPDGSKVFFTANAGLTEETSSEGTDLYEYDFAEPEGERLTDLSVDDEAGGAEVRTFLGASEDGSTAYFMARGQLVHEKGRTFEDNQRAGGYSVYVEHEGRVSFAFTWSSEDVSSARVVSEVSAEGRYLLFEGKADYTAYRSGGTGEAYLFDADSPSEPLVCVSCRQDGEPPVASTSYPVLSSPANNKLNPPRHLAVRDGVVQVFFANPEPLAPGAVREQKNVYEWSHGQVFLLASGVSHGGPVGISADGSNAYFYTSETLNWEDGDARTSVYDARVGGGFPEPPPPPAPCDPTAEASCQGPVAGGPTSPAVGTTSHSGPGNVRAQTPRKCGKGKVRRHGRCVRKPHKARHHKKRHGHHKKGRRHKKGERNGKGQKQRRHAHGDRRAGK